MAAGRPGRGHAAGGSAVTAALAEILADRADPLDTELPRWMTNDNAKHAHRRNWQQLKGRPAQW
jgi:enoyl-CoA hydratase